MIEFKGTTPLLKASDLRATAAYYCEVLGFTVDTLWPEDAPTLCILDRGNVHLMFGIDADWDAPGSPATMTGQLVFDVAGVQDLFESIRNRVDVLWGPEVYSYGRREFSIRDPNGYRLAFSEPTTDPATGED